MQLGVPVLDDAGFAVLLEQGADAARAHLGLDTGEEAAAEPAEG